MAKGRKQRAIIPATNSQRTPHTPKLIIDLQGESSGRESQKKESVLQKESEQLEEVIRMVNSAKKEELDKERRSEKNEKIVEEQSKPVTSKVWSDFDISKLRSFGAKLDYVKPQLVGDVLMGKLEDEDVEPEIEYWKNAIVCYVLGANPPFQVMNGYLRRTWGKFGIDKILLLPNSIWLIRFKSYEMKLEVLNQGVIHFDSRPVIVKDYAIDEDWSKKEVKTVPIWIRLPGLPLKYWNAKALGKIISPLGVPVMVDPLTLKKDRVGYARVLLDVVIQEDLPEKVYFLNNKDQVIEQKVEFEWRPTYCSGCKGYGHLVVNCRKGAKDSKIEYRMKEDQVEKKKDKGKEKITEEQKVEAEHKEGGVEVQRDRQGKKDEGGSTSRQGVTSSNQKQNTQVNPKGNNFKQGVGNQEGSGNQFQHLKHVDNG